MLTQHFIMGGLVPLVKKEKPKKYKELYPMDAKKYINKKGKRYEEFDGTKEKRFTW